MRSQQSRSTSLSLKERGGGRTKPVVKPEYIVGLTDGEGCFYVNIRPPQSKTGRPWIETHFYLKVRIDDLPMLEAVKDALGCGAVYFQRENRPNHTQCCRYEINSRKNIRENVIPFFTRHPLLSVKQNDFRLFATISQMIDREEHLTPSGFAKIRQLKGQMNYRTRRVRENRSLGPDLPSGTKLY